MIIQFEPAKLIGQGSNASIINDETGKVSLIYLPAGLQQLHMLQSDIALGDWGTLSFSGSPIVIGPDKDIEFASTHYIPDAKTWFVWDSPTRQRIAVHTDEGELHDPASPYRLYYAVDTEKLYMNIADTWQFIGSPNIDLLQGYSELLQRLSKLEDDVAALQQP